MKFRDPERLAVSDDVFFVSIDVFNAHERNVVDGVAGRVEMVNDWKFFLLKFDVGFGVCEPCVELSSSFTDILEVAMSAGN